MSGSAQDQDQDLYTVLGVPRTATGEEIRKQYHKLSKDIGLPHLKGLLNKYEALGDLADEDTVKILKEKIEEASETQLLLNQANEVLSDPVKRAKYDAELDSLTPPPPPEVPPDIVIDCSGMDLGRMKEADSKVASFVVDNKGGPVVSINIDWERQPVWGEIQVKPTLGTVFPIEVKVTVKATTAGGRHRAKILVNADGEVKAVPVVFTCVVEPVSDTTYTPTATPAYTPSPRAPLSASVAKTVSDMSRETKGRVLTLLLILGVVLFGGYLIHSRLAYVDEISTQEVEQATRSVQQTEELPNQISESFATQNATASRLDLEGEISAFARNPAAFVTIERIGAGIPNKEEPWVYYGLYEVENHSKFSWVTIGEGSGSEVGDFYTSVALPVPDNDALYPGGVRQLNAGEELYYGGAAGWQAGRICIDVTLNNQTANYGIEKCFNPPIEMDLSQYVHITARTLPTNNINHTGLLEVTFEVDKEIPYLPVSLGEITMTPETDSYYDYLYQQDPTDSRVLVMSQDAVSSGTTVEYVYLDNNYQPSSVCINIGDAYAANGKVCSSVQ